MHREISTIMEIYDTMQFGKGVVSLAGLLPGEIHRYYEKQNEEMRLVYDKAFFEWELELKKAQAEKRSPDFSLRPKEPVRKLLTLSPNVSKSMLISALEESGKLGCCINATELVAALINQRPTITEGLLYAQEQIKGSMSILLLTEDGLYASRDRLGRTPIVIGRKEGAFCASFESFAYINLGYTDYRELGPGEIVKIHADGVETLSAPREEMKICSFLWVYYGYPTSTYEGVNVEKMRYECGKRLARRDEAQPDIVAGVPDSGIAHAIGYANESGVPFARPFIKYTPTWPRSFMPQNQSQRNLIARMKLIPVDALIRGNKLLLIDDSIVRGTQLGETTEFLYQSGAKEVHIRPACPPLLFGCPYLNFSRSTSELDLITRRIIRDREGDNISPELLDDYANPDSQNYKEMVEEIRKRLNFTSLQFHRLDDLIESIGLEPCKLCTYCWNGKE